MTVIRSKPIILRVTFVLVLLAACSAIGVRPAEACPNCRVALEQNESLTAAGDSPQRPGAARAYNVSILAMFGVLATVAFFLIRLLKTAAREADAETAERLPALRN